jgi:hypothetical protein
MLTTLINSTFIINELQHLVVGLFVTRVLRPAS